MSKADISPDATSATGLGLRRSALRSMALEQRFMFDGAAMADAIEVISGADVAAKAEAKAPLPSAVIQAERAAQQKVADFLSKATDQEIFGLFNGSKSAPDIAWADRLTELREVLDSGQSPVGILAMDRASQFTAIAAFTEKGPDGRPTIFVNPYWANLLETQDLTQILVEELGHWMDSRLNPEGDTQGDEGARLAGLLVPEGSNAGRTDISANDRGWVQLDGVSYEAEFASFNFVNAYEMVYDQNNNSTAAGGVVTGGIDVNERWADKEQNLHYFNSSVSLGVVKISDGSNNLNFSGNDVSAIAVTVGNTNYYGWISRPIKANGVVRGFYFWTDDRFTSLGAAQADGNQDGDSEVKNNRGFVFVVDQAWFNSQIAATAVVHNGTANPLINNVKDGNLGSITVANVGSSSDRVDSALNGVMTPNSPPLAANDSLTVLEDSTTTTRSAANGLLVNDSDPNNDALTITGFTVSGTTITLASATGTYNIAGSGTITIRSDGSYDFTPAANFAGAVPPITYTVSDGKGGTTTAVLSITVTNINDAPVGTDKTITTKENVAYALTAADFGFSDPSDAPPNNFASVIITTLPTAGTLTLNGTPVSAGQEITLSAIAGLRYLPAVNSNGSGYATMTFQVRDDGGTANGGVNLDASANTLTFDVQAANSAPAGVSDSATVGEAGGVNNGTNPTPNVTGNVLSNDTDPDVGDTKTVTAVIGNGTGAVGSSVAGKYGSLVLNSNGTYTYTVNNSNATVQALRLNTQTVTDVFTYTVTDAAGLSSTTTLSVTITGANDFPDAQDDYDAVKEQAAVVSTGVWATTTGSVVPNDTDVDGGSLVVESVSTTIAQSDVLTVSSPIASATVTAVQAAGTNWTANGGIGTSSGSAQTVLLAGNAINRSDGLGVLTAYRSGTGANAVLIFNHTLTLYQFSASTVFGVTGSDSTFTIGTITPTVTSSTVLDVTAGTIAAVQVGDQVTGTGIPNGITVTAVDATAKTVTLSQSVQITNREITFTGAGGSSSSQNIIAGSSATLTGNYGNLILASSGNYTYNLTNSSLNDGQTATEAFTYTVNDSAGGTDTAVLYIRIDGRSAVAVAAANDTYAVNEDTTLSITSTGSGILANDTASSTVSSYTWGSLTTSIGSEVTYPEVGKLTLNANGTFTFVPAANFNGTVPAVVYTISNGAGKASAVLNITVNPVNDAPTAGADTSEAREAGGYSNGVVGYDPTGNVLNNDTDPDGNALSVSAVSKSGGSAGTVGQPVAGNYGSLTLNTDGTYTYQVSNSAATVQALASGQLVTDVFNYTTTDSSATSSSTLTITLRGANDAPANTVPSSTFSASMGSSTTITGISVDDVDDTSLTVTLAVAHGTLNIGTAGLTFSNGANGQSSFTVSGTKSAINTALGNLSYTPGATYVSVDTLSIRTQDSGGLEDLDTVAITMVDNRPLTVTGTRVNEASAYVMFRVSGAVGQTTTLSLGSTASTTDVDASKGTDYLPNMQYFDGSNWQNYTGQPVAILTGGVLLVRTPVLQDTSYEGEETLTLTATNRAGTGSTPGVSTIVDDGTGQVFLGNNNSFTPNNPGDIDPSGPDYPSYLDDDRPVTVTNVVVNEASAYAVFTVTGTAGQILRLAMSDGTAQLGTDTASASTFEIYNGSGWVSYTAGTDLTLAASTLRVRLALTQDSVFEQGETFHLGVTQMGSGVTAYGKATILDDGNGEIFTFDNDNNPANDPQNPTPTTGPGVGFDDDRPLSVTAYGPVNEGSTYAMFTIDAAEGYSLDLSLQGTAVVGDREASYAGFTTIEYSSDGTNWVTYSNTSKPTVPASGKVYVRVTITSEVDTVLEGPEGFALNAAYTSNTAKSAAGETSIVDDGTGKKYGPNMPGGTPAESTAGLDDDRSLSVAAYGPINEGSTYAVFTVTGNAGYGLDLSLQGTAAVGDAEANFSSFTTIEYSSNGTTWTSYSSSSKPTVPTNGKVYVRVTITSEADALYEGSEGFGLLAAYTTNTGKNAVGETSIVDDGSGRKYGPDMPGGLPTEILTGLDDDRDPAVSSPIVNEGSPFIVFTVSSRTGVTVTLSLGTTGMGDGYATLGADVANSMQVYNGSNWVPYVSSTPVVIGANSEVLVRIPVNQDNLFEISETFELIASTGVLNQAGTGTILDDGNGAKYEFDNDADPTPSITVGPGAGFDDDRPLEVTGYGPINEGSTHAMFTVTAASGYLLDLSLQGTAAAGDAEASFAGFNLIEYSTDGTNWTTYSGTSKPTVPSNGKVYVRVTITSEADDQYEGSEGFGLKAAYSSNSAKSAAGETSIVDDGSGKKYGPNMPSGTREESSNGLDDDRSITVAGLDDVSEGSNAIFTVSLPDGNTRATEISLALSNGSGANDAEANDYSNTFTAYYYNGATQQALTITAGKITLPAGITTFYVKAPTTQDTDLEGAENFSLTASITGGKSASDTSTIVDNGTGKIYDDKGLSPTGPGNDDRTLSVTAYGPVNEASTYAMFTVDGIAGNSLDLSLQGTAATGDAQASFAGFTPIEFSTDGTNWTVYSSTSKPTVPAGGRVYVRVTITSEADNLLEGSEGFGLKAAYTSNSAKSAAGETSIVDDGSGKKYGPNMPGGTPAESTAGLDDDTPKPAPPAPPPPPPASPELPAAPATPPAPEPVRAPTQVFNSTLQPPEAKRLEPAAPPMPPMVAEVLTSSRGFAVVVDTTQPAGLQVFKGITDQFVEGTAAAKVSMPYDAFVHSKADAVIQLNASRADGTSLPPWVRFDPRSGSFEVDPASSGGFKGRIDVKVTATDNEGREATVLFRMFVGEQPPAEKPADKPQSRNSLSEKLRLAAKRSALVLPLDLLMPIDLTAPAQTAPEQIKPEPAAPDQAMTDPAQTIKVSQAEAASAH